MNVLHNAPVGPQLGLPSARPVRFGGAPVESVYVIERLEVLSVAPAGAGLDGVVVGFCLLTGVRCLLGGDVANISNALAHKNKRTAVKTRGLKRPDCDEDFFRMEKFSVG